MNYTPLVVSVEDNFKLYFNIDQKSYVTHTQLASLADHFHLFNFQNLALLCNDSYYLDQYGINEDCEINDWSDPTNVWTFDFYVENTADGSGCRVSFEGNLTERVENLSQGIFSGEWSFNKLSREDLEYYKWQQELYLSEYHSTTYFINHWWHSKVLEPIKKTWLNLLAKM